MRKIAEAVGGEVFRDALMRFVYQATTGGGDRRFAWALVGGGVGGVDQCAHGEANWRAEGEIVA